MLIYYLQQGFSPRVVCIAYVWNLFPFYGTYSKWVKSGAVLIYRKCLTVRGIFTVKIRQSRDRPIFTMGIPILVLYWSRELALWLSFWKENGSHITIYTISFTVTNITLIAKFMGPALGPPGAIWVMLEKYITIRSFLSPVIQPTLAICMAQ